MRGHMADFYGKEGLVVASVCVCVCVCVCVSV